MAKNDVTYRYGGLAGVARGLRVRDEYLVVRTRSRLPVHRVCIGKEARSALADFEPVVSFHEAGVQVYRCRQKTRRKDLRDRARALLKKEEAVHFAGRVLCDPSTYVPAVYTENLFVKLRAGVRKAECLEVLADTKLTVDQKVPYAENAFVAKAPDGSGLEAFAIAEELLADERVELCHPEIVRERKPRAAAPEQWHLRRTRIGGRVISQHSHVTDAWRLSRGEGIVIAVIDDGVDVTHPELGGDGKVVAPRDVTRKTGDASPKCSEDSHGTPGAGGACGSGLHRASGVAPDALLMPIRNASGLGSQNEARAFYWAARHGADVISCSWGPPDGEWWNPEDPQHDQVTELPDSTRLAIDYAVDEGREGRGCVVLFASGNGNESVDNDGYASYPRVIAVAACNDRGRRSVYSDYGDAVWCCFPSSDDRRNTRTPGVWTTDRTDGAGYNCGGPNAEADRRGNYTSSFGGTSSACPGAAGVAALVLARNPELGWADVRELLKQSCDKIDAKRGQYKKKKRKGHSRFYGYGRLNARKAVELADGFVAAGGG